MSTTKLELTQINARLATENAELRTQLAQFEVAAEMATKTLEQCLTERARLIEANDALCAQLLAVTSVASAVNKMHKPRPEYVMPQWQVERAAAMAAAKAAAVAGHTTVRV